MTTFVITFALYAFAGWVLETIYRSIKKRRLVNPGFLSGPFLPIYGFFTMMVIYSYNLLSHIGWIWQFVCFVIISTLLEYIAGWFFERFFHLQLWDYHKIPLNFQGRIALPFSLLWGVLGLIFQFIVHPQVQFILLKIPVSFSLVLTTILIVYVILDIIHSTLLLHRLELFICVYQELYERLELQLFQRAFLPFRRLLTTYPRMRHTVSEKMALLFAKQELLENFIRLQRKKFYDSNS